MDPISAGIGLASQAFGLIQGNKDRRRAEEAQRQQQLFEINSQIAANNRNNVNAASSNAEMRARDAALQELLKSSKTDVYGNTTVYVDGVGFVSTASPIVQAILNAQTREQLSTLTEDAPKAREARNRKDARSKTADDQYQRVFNEVTSRYRKPSEEYEAESVLSALEDRKGVGNPVSAALVSQAIRSGNPAMVSQLSAAGRGSGGSVRSTIQTGKDAGFSRYAGRKSAQDQLDFNELGQLRGIANDTDVVSIPYNNTGEMLSNERDSAMSALSQAIAGSTINTLPQNQPIRTSGIQPSPALDYTGLFEQLGTTFAKDTTDYELEALLREAKMSQANASIAKDKYDVSKYNSF